MPLQQNLLEYGMRDKVPDILLNQNQVDFRDTIGEIVKDYPFSKVQQQENEKSHMNLYRVHTTASRTERMNKTEFSRFGWINVESKGSLAHKSKELRLQTADQSFQEPNEQRSARGSSEIPSIS